MPSSPKPPPEERRRRIQSSALWAAWGDALGFICELTDAEGVRRRVGRWPVEETAPWRRRIGGRAGPTIELPAGCLSDDTQLRLAVCRSIRSGVGFDPQLFAGVELTVWPSYALGAGRGSKVAAANLLRRDASWSTNFFDAPRAVYINGGGNGAAMRIQPHVWSAPTDAPVQELLTAVVCDSVCTHGHMRGILGAAHHALTLRRALRDGYPPGPEEWRDDVAVLEEIGPLISKHEELGGLWLSMWEHRTQQKLQDAITQTLTELSVDIARLGDTPGSGSGAYEDAVEALGAFREDQRGSGTKTALLAAFVAWRLGEPAVAVRTAANRLATDTDSIATMAGAVLGATGAPEPEGAIADREYLIFEADRMWAVSQGLKVTPFPHPDIRRWVAPKTQSDAAGRVGDRLAVTGLGPADPASELLAASAKNAGAWQWIDLWFGQRLLIKRRLRPPALESSQVVQPIETYSSPSLLGELQGLGSQTQPSDVAPSPAAFTLHQLTDAAIKSRFDPHLIGEQLLSLLDRDDGVEAAVAYAAIMAKARLSRRDRDNGRPTSSRRDGSPGDT